jgi:hypothetical protein
VPVGKGKKTQIRSHSRPTSAFEIIQSATLCDAHGTEQFC